MFPLKTTKWALEAENVDRSYNRRDMWKSMTSWFDPSNPEGGFPRE